MQGAFPYMYDRVEIYLPGGIEYLPNGMIRSFKMDSSYNTTVNQGFSKNGIATGKTIGNKSIIISWSEYLADLENFLNWRTFCIANPNAVFTVVPISLATRVPVAPNFTITGIDPTSISTDASGEGSAMMRNISLNAIDSSNT